MIDTTFSYIKYLSAKKHLDNRTINKTVFDALKDNLAPTSAEKVLSITEFGSGIGTMIERLIDWGLLKECVYTSIEQNDEFIMQTVARLRKYADANEFHFSEENEQPNVKLIRLRKNALIRIRLIASDFFDVNPKEYQIPSQDLIIAHTFLDIFHLPDALTHMLSFLKEGGLFYLTSNYDGITHFLPHSVPEIDRKMESLYNQSMDIRSSDKKQGGSRCGSQLFSEIYLAGGQILESGSSDWVIFPGENNYHPDEKYFVECIIKTAARAITETGDISEQEVALWVHRKLDQLYSNQLIFQAHQLDFMGKKL